LEEILTHKFFSYRSLFEDFLNVHVGGFGGTPLKA